MKISASIYSNKTILQKELVRELDSYYVDYLHIDCIEDLSVFNDISVIRKYSSTPIDLHIISSNPEKFYKPIIENKIELVCFQYENLTSTLNIPSEMHSRIGIGIINETPIEVLKKYLNQDRFNFGLLMTTIPGKSGGVFNKMTYKRVKEFKQMFPSKEIHIDGGVDNHIASELRKLEVNCSVSGSYLVRSNFIGKAIMKLRSDFDKFDFSVTEVMLQLNQIPIIKEKNLSIRNVIKTINTYRMGFTLIVNDASQLVGIITDGDIRNEVLNNLENLNNISWKGMLNKKPVVILDTSLVNDAFKLFKKSKNPILFLPVVDISNTLKGVISVNQLIRGQL